VIVDNPETTTHPVIAVVLHQLRARHTLRLLDLLGLTGPAAIAREAAHAPADLYLLKSHAQQALELAYHLEQRGAMVVNPWAAAVACWDRLLMTERMRQAHLPWPQTWSFATPGHLLAQLDLLVALPFPLMLKSRYSRRGDLVAKLLDVDQLQALAGPGGEPWHQEPIIVQEFAASDGWEIRISVIDEELFATRRRSPLDVEASREDRAPTAVDLRDEWARLAREVGRVFNLRVYALDLLLTERGPLVIDVDVFPGFRDVPGADRALVALVNRLAGTSRTRTIASGREPAGRESGSAPWYRRCRR